MTPVIRAYEATIDDVKVGERSVVARIGGTSVDRHRTIIEPKGIDLESYRRNPVVLWEHGRDIHRGMMPVGKNQWIKTDGERLIAKTVFRNDDYSQELFRAYQEGDLRGWSVNVLAHEASPPTREEMRAAPHLEQCDLVYRRTELNEYSAVAIPSYRDALTVLASRGIWIPEDAFIARYITHSDGKYTVHAEDGKPMGTYGSKEEAEKRLREIEYFKHHDRGMSDSGGMATGGAAVKPHRVKKRGETYVVEDEDGNELSEHDDPGEAQQRLGMPAPKRSAPASAEPRIECDGQSWTLWVGETRILDAEDAETVERAAAALSVSRTWDDVRGDLMTQQTMAQERAILELREKLALKLEGRV